MRRELLQVPYSPRLLQAECTFLPPHLHHPSAPGMEASGLIHRPSADLSHQKIYITLNNLGIINP